jgi:ATP phosphoribosyltransferase
VVEARARGKVVASLRWPVEQDEAAAAAIAPFLDRVNRRSDGLLAPQADLFDIAAALQAAGVEAVSITRPDYVFKPRCEPIERLKARLRA